MSPVQRAKCLAVKSRHAIEEVAELEDWAQEHHQFLEIIWTEFREHGTWPVSQELTRRLFGRGVRMPVEDIARDMPPPLGRFDPQHRQVLLTVRGAAQVSDARDDCGAFVQVVRTLVERYGTAEVEAVVVTGELAEIADVDEGGSRRLEQLCQMESWCLLAQGGQPGAMRFGLNEAVVFTIADVATIGEYLDAQADAWWPETDPAWSLAQFAAAAMPASWPVASAPRRQPSTATADHLHPLIATAAAPLLADGHRREAIERAGVALQDAVRNRSGLSDADGDNLMNVAFSPKSPRLAVADLATANGKNVQRGTHLIAQGIVAAIRNPTSHRLVDPGPDETIEQLSILSFVARRLDDAIDVEDDSNREPRPSA